MIGTRPFDVHHFRDCGVGKPWEGFERQEQLPTAKPQPEAMARNIRYFNVRSDAATLSGFVAHGIGSLPRFGLIRAAQFCDSPPVRLPVPSKTSPRLPTTDMHVHSRLFAREEVKTIRAFPKDRRTHLT